MMLKLTMLLSNGLGVIEITFISILISSFLLKVDGNKAAGNCTYSDKEHKCCTNYYNVNGTCTQCPKGTFGNNCSARCPDNMYGDLCVNICDCKSNQMCNRMHGCIECPKGTFGENCSEQCPRNMYGDLCTEKCDCKANQQCHHVHGCIDLKSITGLFYWIIPVLIGIVIFICICIYRRSQPRKRQFVDIPLYQQEINDNTRDNYDHMTDITMAKNGKTIDNRKLGPTSPATITREVGTTDEIQDTGEYHTLNLRVFDYEEPIKHEQLKRSQSENSSLYFDCQSRMMASGIDDNNVSNCRRGSSLRQIRSTNDHIHESDAQKLTRERHFVPQNYVSKNVNNSEPTFGDFDLHNPTTLERKNMVPQNQLFLNELSSHLFNLQKY